MYSTDECIAQKHAGDRAEQLVMNDLHTNVMPACYTHLKPKRSGRADIVAGEFTQ